MCATWSQIRLERCARHSYSGEGAFYLADEKQDEKAYEVKDKRRVNPDGSLREEAEPEPKATPEQTPAEEPQAKAAEEPKTAPPVEEMPPPNVYETLQFMTGMLAEQAWVFMGLHLPPGRKEPVTDLAQARIAIDAVIFLADKIHPHLGEDDRKALRSIVSDLQINFVQRNQS